MLYEPPPPWFFAVWVVVFPLLGFSRAYLAWLGCMVPGRGHSLHPPSLSVRRTKLTAGTCSCTDCRWNDISESLKLLHLTITSGTRAPRRVLGSRPGSSVPRCKECGIAQHGIVRAQQCCANRRRALHELQLPVAVPASRARRVSAGAPRPGSRHPP